MNEEFDITQGAAVNYSMTVVDFGEDKAYEEIERALSAHNNIVKDLLRNFCGFTTAQTSLYGNLPMGYPLQRHSMALGWSEEWLKNHTVADLAQHYVLANLADIKHIQKDFNRALFNPTNNLGYQDHLVDSTIIPLRAFFNGDQEESPVSTHGKPVDLNHTHYTASEHLDAKAITDLVENVVEHGVVGELVLIIHKDQQAEVQRLLDLDLRAAAIFVQDGAYGTAGSPVNKVVGKFTYGDHEVTVWVKPWCLKNYMVAIDKGRDEETVDDVVIPSVKPFAVRYLKQIGMDLKMGFEHEAHPLRAQVLKRTMGIGVANRHMVAVHQIGSTIYMYDAYEAE